MIAFTLLALVVVWPAVFIRYPPDGEYGPRERRERPRTAHGSDRAQNHLDGVQGVPERTHTNRVVHHPSYQRKNQ